MKPAFIKWYGKKNGQERKATLRAGTKGTGKIIETVNYWPDSAASNQAAWDIFQSRARIEGYQIVGSDRNEA